MLEETNEEPVTLTDLFNDSIGFKIAFIFALGIISGLFLACFSLGGFAGIAFGIAGIFTTIFWIVMLIVCITKITENLDF